MEAGCGESVGGCGAEGGEKSEVASVMSLAALTSANTLPTPASSLASRDVFCGAILVLPGRL